MEAVAEQVVGKAGRRVLGGVKPGDRYGKLVVIERDYSHADLRYAYWLCRCDCGKTCVVRNDRLFHGVTKSCGCLRSCAHRASKYKTNVPRGEFKRVPGLWGFAAVWRAMQTRCDNPSAWGYEYYGGEGKMVCERWRDFGNFRADLFEEYCTQKLLYGSVSIDRKDMKLGYEPGNTQFIGAYAQNGNTRKNKWFIAENTETGIVVFYRNVAAFARRFGLRVNAIRYGLYVKISRDKPYRGWLLRLLTDEEIVEKREQGLIPRG